MCLCEDLLIEIILLKIKFFLIAGHNSSKDFSSGLLCFVPEVVQEWAVKASRVGRLPTPHLAQSLSEVLQMSNF